MEGASLFFQDSRGAKFLTGLSKQDVLPSPAVPITIVVATAFVLRVRLGVLNQTCV